MIAPNRLHNLDLGTLRSFVTIAESGSMTRAASRLFMTQSAISMQIKRLESSLGLSVFDRSAQGMSTTTEGDQLLNFATKMLALNDEAMGRLTSPDYEGQIRLGVPADVVYPNIPPILREFSRDYPRVQIKFSTESTYRLLSEFRQGQHDIVLTTEDTPGPDGLVISTQSLVWTGGDDGQAWKKRPLPLGFAKHCAFRAGVINALDKVGIDWIDLVASEDVVAIEAMISADLCVSARLENERYASSIAIEHGGQLPALPAHSVVLYSNQSSASPITESLVEYLKRAYG